MGSQSPVNTPPNHSNHSAQSFLPISGLNDPSEIFHQLRAIFGSREYPIYLVGGAVRDIVYGRSLKDLDFVVRVQALGRPLLQLSATLVTSSRRYQQQGWLSTTIKHVYLTWTLTRQAKQRLAVS